MFFRVLNSIRAVPSYSPSSDRVGRMWRRTDAVMALGVEPRRTAAEHLLLGEQLLVNLESDPQAYLARNRSILPLLSFRTWQAGNAAILASTTGFESDSLRAAWLGAYRL